MSKSDKPARSASIADVAHPGTSAPSDTSKPIINQRPMIKDPMVVEDEKPDAETKQPLSRKTSKAKLAPLDDKKTEDSKPEPGPEPEPEIEPAKAEEPEGGDETLKDKQKPKADDDAKTATQAKTDAKLLRLIESKKYFLPINAVEHRRSARFTAAGIILALILVIAWANIALDAGLIHLGGVKPVTHLFSN